MAPQSCTHCWHWSAPLALRERLIPGGTVPLTFEQWVLYHWHVVTHQGGVSAMAA